MTLIISKPTNPKSRKGWDRVFKRKKQRAVKNPQPKQEKRT